MSDGLSADGKTVLFRPANAGGRRYPCDGYVYEHNPRDNRPCPHQPGWVDPRDGSLYCTMHRDAVQAHGVDGQNVRVRP